MPSLARTRAGMYPTAYHQAALRCGRHMMSDGHWQSRAGSPPPPAPDNTPGNTAGAPGPDTNRPGYAQPDDAQPDYAQPDYTLPPDPFSARPGRPADPDRPQPGLPGWA